MTTWRIQMAVAMMLCVAVAGAAEPRITLELATEAGFSITGQQKLAQATQRLDIGSVRIRPARPGERPTVEDTRRDGSAFSVVALVTRDGTIVVPGKRFGSDQMPQFKLWLSRLATDNPNKPKEEIAAFGLTPEQLVTTHERLSGKVTFSTRGKTCFEVAKTIAKDIPLQLSIDADARAALEAGEVMPDELEGLSHGTALAAALRPAGLVFAPVRSGDDVRLRIASSRALPEAWPIGWNSEKGLTATLPAMGKFLNVEIKDVVLSEALDSIQKRVDAPFLYDHNGLARQQIDPTKLRCSLPQGKTYYKAILDRILSPAHLKCEVRIDEADKPFVWISTVK
jgi:hypothetical protein